MGYTYVMSDIHGMGALLEKMLEYVGFMKSLPFYKKLKLEDKCFLLAHASTEEILQAWKKKERLIWDTSMVDRKKGIPGYVSIVGHVPTFVIRGFPKEAAKIWHSPDGRLQRRYERTSGI